MNDDQRGRSPGPDAPGNPWVAAARELVADPDSPASLRIMSAFNAGTRPMRAAVGQLLAALAEQTEHPGDAADAAVGAAVHHWETACGAPLPVDVLESLRQEAIELVAQRKRQPPAVESIVAGVGERTDVGYALHTHMEGLRGTWHRLWAAIAMGRLWDDTPEQQECVAEVRSQFEGVLGRALSTDEWARLEQHAHDHGDTMASAMRDKEK